VAARAAKAEVVQAGAVLIEGTAGVPMRRTSHQHAGAGADAVHAVLVPEQRLHPEEVAEPLPERDAARRVVHGELDVREAVQLDGHRPSLPRSRRASQSRVAPDTTLCEKPAAWR